MAQVNLDPSKNLHYESRKPNAFNVHRVVDYLTFSDHMIYNVKFCPCCLMCEFGQNASGYYYHCKTCGELLSDADLEDMDRYEYLNLIKQLPLRNRGETLVISHNSKDLISMPDVCYDDLSPIQLMELNSLLKHEHNKLPNIY